MSSATWVRHPSTQPHLRRPIHPPTLRQTRPHPRIRTHRRARRPTPGLRLPHARQPPPRPRHLFRPTQACRRIRQHPAPQRHLRLRPRRF
ncbi:MAG: hypothetical protein AMJ93_06365 [Anaerolineae bacterium SM23_84]|nr:MAG: hypothetical protein AMJ93_06365 [Anaerolineae bacterium SM23_84]